MSTYISELFNDISGIDSPVTVTITGNPAGTPVSGFVNTYDYPILSSVTLTCNVASNGGSFTVTSYQWNTAGCYTNSKFTGSTPQCFPHGQATQIVTGYNLNAEDAGTITCTVTIGGSGYASEPITLRVSGEQLVYCVIACIVCCKQCIPLLLDTYILLLYILAPTFMVYVSLYLGVAVTRGGSLSMDNALTDYSYINAQDGDPNGLPQLARCLTGLGPSGTSNSVLGGFYFNGTMIPNSSEQATCSSAIIQVRPGMTTAGITSIHQCEAFSTAAEGVYTCTMLNSSQIEQSVRFGIYLSGRSESLDLYIPSLNDFHPLIQLLQ